jgi:hypothetical protein
VSPSPTTALKGWRDSDPLNRVRCSSSGTQPGSNRCVAGEEFNREQAMRSNTKRIATHSKMIIGLWRATERRKRCSILYHYLILPMNEALWVH